MEITSGADNISQMKQALEEALAVQAELRAENGLRMRTASAQIAQLQEENTALRAVVDLSAVAPSSTPSSEVDVEVPGLGRVRLTYSLAAVPAPL